MVLAPRPSWQLDAGVAALVLVACVVMGALGQPDWYWSAAMSLPLAARRSSPWTFALSVVAISAVHFVLEGRLLLPGDLLVLVAVWAVASRASQPTHHLALLIGVYYAGAMFVQVGTVSDVARASRALLPAAGVIAAVTAAWSVGLLERHRRNALADAENRRRRAEQDAEVRTRLAALEERERMSNEIHDVLAHTLTGIVVQAESGRAITPDGELRELFSRIAATGRAAVGEVRGLLSATAGDTQPSPGIADVEALVATFETDGLHVTRADQGSAQELGTGMAVAIYRVIQESLTNALRHGRDRSAVLTLEWHPESLTVSIVNPVLPGASVQAASDRRGLAGIRRRVALYRGSAEFRVDEEFHVITTWPLGADSLGEAL